MVAQHGPSINHIILYIFINIFILRRSKNEYIFLYVINKKVHHRFIFPTDSVRYSGVSCQLSAQLQNCQEDEKSENRCLEDLFIYLFFNSEQ